MPHLPPPTIKGGSVKIRIPVRDLNSSKAKYKGDLFVKEPKSVIEYYPPGSKKKYEFEEYSVADTHAQIYKVEIRGAGKGEVFEFHPKNGKCTIEIYFATSDELPLSHDDNWLEAKK